MVSYSSDPMAYLRRTALGLPTGGIVGGGSSVAPVPPTGQVALARPMTSRGSSSFTQTGINTAANTLQNRSLANITSGTQAQFQWLGIGGADAPTITTSVQSAISTGGSSTQNGDWLLCYGGNGVDNEGQDDTAFASFQTALTSIGSTSRVCTSNKYNTAGTGSPNYYVNKRFNRLCEAAAPAGYVDWSWSSRHFPPPAVGGYTSTDLLSLRKDSLPPSYQNVSVGHENDEAAGYSYSTWLDDLVRANAAGIPMLPAGRIFYTTGLTADTTILHSLAGTTLSTTDPLVTPSVLSDKVIRLTLDPSINRNVRFREVPITLTKTVGGTQVAITRIVRLVMGNTAAAPQRRRFDGHGLVAPVNHSIGTTTQKISMVFGLKIGDPSFDTATCNVHVGAVQVARGSTGAITITVKNAAGTTVARAVSNSASNSPGGLTPLMSANGWMWIFFEADLTLGASSYARAVVSYGETTGTDKAIAANIIATGGETMAFSQTANPQQFFGGGSELANALPLGTMSLPGEVVGPFIWADVVGVTNASLTDPTTVANRAKFRSASANGTPLDFSDGGSPGTGIFNGVTPILAIWGTLGEVYWGGDGTTGYTCKNRGSGGDLQFIDYEPT